MTRSQPSNYEALDPTSKSIRLLTLKRDADGKINCTTSNYELASAPPFIALSYEWGSKRRLRKTIRLNGKAIQIRRNLWRVLEVFVTHGWPKEIPRDIEYIWIDALSIDQSNVKERNHQVAMMAKIYSQAEHVISWIGPADRHSSDWIMEAASDLRIPDGIDMDCFMDDDEAVEVATENQWDFHHGPLFRMKTQRIKNTVFTRSYWMRLWIIQEIVLSKSCVVLCGLMSSNMNSLLQLSYVLQNYDPLLERVCSRHFETIGHHTKSKSEGRPFQLASSFAWHDCDDKRDKINGFAGLFDSFSHEAPEHAGKWQVDYSENTLCTLTRFLETFALKPVADEDHYSRVVSISASMGIQPRSVMTATRLQHAKDGLPRSYADYVPEYGYARWTKYKGRPLSVHDWLWLSEKKHRHIPVWVIRDLLLEPSFLLLDMKEAWGRRRNRLLWLVKSRMARLKRSKTRGLDDSDSPSEFSTTESEDDGEDGAEDASTSDATDEQNARISVARSEPVYAAGSGDGLTLEDERLSDRTNWQHQMNDRGQRITISSICCNNFTLTG